MVFGLGDKIQSSSWLLKNKKKFGVKELVLSQLENKIKWLMLDTNCLLHPCVANILEKYKFTKDELVKLKNFNDKDNENQYIENLPVEDQNLAQTTNVNEQYIDPVVEQNNQELLIKEQEKYAEKLLVLKNTADAYNFMFLDDIQKRKKEEEKLKKKNQKEK